MTRTPLLFVLAGALVGCGATGAKRDGLGRAGSASASSSAAPQRTPLTVDEAMVALRASRAAAEKTRETSGPRSGAGLRPSRAEFKLAAESLRDAGVKGTVAVMRALGAPRLVQGNLGIVPVLESASSTLVFEVVDDPAPRLLPRRLIARGGDHWRVARVDEESFLLQGNASVLLFRKLDAEPIEVVATTVKPTKSGRVAFFAGDEGWVLDAKTGEELLPRTRGLDSGYTEWTHDDRWLAVCEPSHGDLPVVVVDVAAQKELFRSRSSTGTSVAACAIDHASGELAIAYYAEKAQTVTLESWSLDTGKQLATKVIANTYIPEMRLEMETDTHAVTVVSAPYQGSRSLHGRYDLHTGTALQARKDPAPPPRPRPAVTTKPVDPVADIPVGESDFGTQLGPGLRALASPGKELVSSYFGGNAGWFANGALSQDRTSLALLEDDVGATGAAPAVLIVDVATMKVRHRVGLRGGYNWGMVAFLDANTLVTRLEWHYWLIDASTGAILGSAEHDASFLMGDYENPSLVGRSIAVIGTRLFDVRRGLPDGQDREIATPYASLQAVDVSGDGDDLKFAYEDRYSLTLAKDGAVTFARPAVPDWLVCIVKDEVFPFEACAVWYPDPGQPR